MIPAIRVEKEQMPTVDSAPRFAVEEQNSALTSLVALVDFDFQVPTFEPLLFDLPVRPSVRPSPRHSIEHNVKCEMPSSSHESKCSANDDGRWQSHEGRLFPLMALLDILAHVRFDIENVVCFQNDSTASSLSGKPTTTVCEYYSHQDAGGSRFRWSHDGNAGVDGKY